MYTVEGAGAPMGSVSAFALAEMSQSGQLIGRQVRSAETGRILSNEELGGVLQSIKLPPQLQRSVVQTGPVDGNKDPMRFVAPIHASGWAVAAGYLGLFSLVLVFAPFSLIAGVLAVRDLKANPQKTGKGRAIFGLVMGVVFSVLLLVFFVTVIFASKP